MGAKLTEREKKILELIYLGYKNKEIAQKLGITPGTLGGYIKTIYLKIETYKIPSPRTKARAFYFQNIKNDR